MSICHIDYIFLFFGLNPPGPEKLTLIPWDILYFCLFGWKFSGIFPDLNFFERKFPAIFESLKVAGVARFFENFCLKVAIVAGIFKIPGKARKSLEFLIVAGFWETMKVAEFL